MDHLCEALLQAPLRVQGGARLSPFFLPQWNSTAFNSSTELAQA